MEYNAGAKALMDLVNKETPAQSGAYKRLLADRLNGAALVESEIPCNAPRLLLEVVQRRIRRIAPDEDPSTAAQRLARETGDDTIQAMYWGLTMSAQDAQDSTYYDAESWEIDMDAAEMLLETLDRLND